MNKIAQDWEIISNRIMSILNVITKVGHVTIFKNPLYSTLQDVGFSKTEAVRVTSVFLKYCLDSVLAGISTEVKVKAIIEEWKYMYEGEDYEKLMQALEKSVARC